MVEGHTDESRLPPRLFFCSQANFFFLPGFFWGEIELPQDPIAAKTALRHVEDGYIEAAKANDEPLQNTNAPICRCTRTREQQARWRRANPDYMKTKSREWRQRRKALMAAQGQ